MQARNSVAKQAATEIEAWLRLKQNSIAVTNVEDRPEYQSQDVDLIWKTTKREIGVEIKSDTYSGDRNFFLETISNKEKGTPGSFLYTSADYVFYYFVKPKKLFVLPMPKTREWFLKNMRDFREAVTETDVGNGEYYTTVGRLVPISVLMQNVNGVRLFQL